jgi:hypothetical protein
MIIAWAFLAAASAHMCMFAPTQRGGLDGSVNDPAALKCAGHVGPCGNQPNSLLPTQIMRANVPFIVVIQKNLDHYNSTNPGYFAVSFADVADPSESDFTTLLQIPDGPASVYPDQYLFFANVSVQAKPLRHGVLRSTYITNNVNAGNYFSCTSSRAPLLCVRSSNV